MVELLIDTQISGLFSLIFIFVVFPIAILNFYKGYKTKERLFYIFCIFTLSIASPWYSSGFGFFYWLITKELLVYQVYITIGIVGIPIIMISWFFFYTSLMEMYRKTLVLVIVMMFSILYYIIFFIVLFAYPEEVSSKLLGIIINDFDIRYQGFVLFYIGVSLLIVTPTYFKFSLVSIRKKEEPVMVWRGRLFIMAIVVYDICAICEAFLELSLILLIIVRIALGINMLIFYLAIVMPDWFQKLLRLEIEK